MLDFETDEDAHFECPQCGQKGSVPKATIEKALAETPHVYISCSNCAHKFEPFASAENMQPNQPTSASLEAQWTQGEDDGESEKDATAAGSLPSWMMPAEKPPEEAPETREEETREEETPEEETPEEETPPSAPTEEKEEAITNTRAEPESDASDGAESDAAIKEPPAPLAVEETTAQIEAEAEPVIEAETVIEDTPAPIVEPVAEPLVEPVVAPTPYEDPIPEVAADEMIDAPRYAPAEPEHHKSPSGFINSLLVVLALILLAASAYVFMTNRTMPAPGVSSDALSTKNIELKNAGFVRFTDDGEAGVEVSIRFENTSTERGLIGDFRIELQNEARERLVQWTILSSGETIPPGQTRTLTSVLFGPPKGLAHVNIVYPLAD